MLQRSTRDRTNEVAPKLRIRLDVLHRIDGIGGRLCRRLKRFRFKRTTFQSGLCFGYPPRTHLSAANSDPRLGNDAIDKRYVTSAIAIAKSPARRLNSWKPKRVWFGNYR